MIDNETIDSFLIQMDLPAEPLRDGMWKLERPDDSVPPLIVSHEPPIVCVRLKVMDVPACNREKLFERLLRYNANGLAFGAYALEDDQVVLIDTLRDESLVMAELQASIESLELAVSQHYRELQALLQGEE